MQDLKNDFPALRGHTYLNTASSGLLSRSLYLWRKENDLDFINNGANFKIRKQIPEDTRATVASFFNAAIDEVALIPNFSFGFNIILEGLPKGQKVLMLKNDYPSLLWPIETRDFNVCYAEINEHLENNITVAFEKQSPDIFVFSIVQWLSGIKINLKFIKELKEKYPDVIFMADATQYFGTEHFDFTESGLDVIGGSCYKWMLAGFGNGLMLVKKEVQSKIFPTMIGFNSAATFDSKAQETTFIKHFEPGHQDTFNYGSLQQAILQIEKYGIAKISEKIKTLSSIAREHFLRLDLLKESTKNRNEHSSIYNLKGDAELFKKLTAQNIVCSPRGGGIRVSFHYYNTKEDVSKLVEVLKENL